MANFYPATVSQLIADINTANGNSETNLIHLEAGQTYEFSQSLGFNLALPYITNDLTILGNNAIFKATTTGIKLLEAWENTHLEIRDLTIQDFDVLDAEDIGAAMRIGCETLRLTNCTFQNNKANLGGAVSFQGVTDIFIDTCNFNNNTAASYSGAIHSNSTNLIIRNSVFDTNHVNFGWGGAIGIGSHERLVIDGCQFINNDADFDGPGASGAQGGAIFYYGDILYISKSAFINNTAHSGSIDNGEGGAIWANALVTILDSSFDSNQADSSPALHIDFSESVRVNFCDFTNNRDTNGDPIPIIDYSSDPLSLDNFQHNCWNGEWIYENLPNYLPYMLGCDGPILQDREVPEEASDSDNDAASDCDTEGNSNVESNNPFSLREGEKRLKATDIRLATSQGELGFHRAYRQSTQADRDFMGRGWSHNHRLILDHSMTDQITVDRPEGKTRLYKSHDVDANTVRYIGARGARVYIDEDTSTTPSTYTMVSSDKTITNFAESLGSSLFGLTSRQMANGDAWYYHYDSGDLVLVHDDPNFNGSDESNINWALRFAYYSTSDFKDGKLWRVGIKETSNLTTTPSGSYVEFDYAEDNTDEVYLTRVRDLRNYSQCYRYGFQEGETDTTLKTYLVKRIALLTEGETDCSDSNKIVLEEVSYTLTSGEISAIEQERGDAAITKELVFGTDTTIERIKGYSSHEISHDFTNGIYRGTTDADNNAQSTNPSLSYRKALEKDRNGNPTMLKWSADGQRLEGVIDGVYAETDFLYDPLNRLLASTDAEGRTSLYEYENDYREPLSLRLTNGNNLIANGNMEADDSWSDIAGSAPVTNRQRPANIHFGRYIEADSDEGIESIPWDLTASKTYQIWINLEVISGTVKAQVPGHSTLDATTSTDGWLKSPTYTPGSGATDVTLQIIASGGAAEFYVKQVIIFEDDSTDIVRLPIYGDMIDDAYWSNISGNEPNIHEHVSKQHYNGVSARYVLADAADEGIENDTDLSLVVGTTYQILAYVRPVSGTVKMQIHNGSSVLASDSSGTGTDEWEKLSITYTHTGSNETASLQFIADGTAAEFYLDTVYALDDSIILRQQSMTYDSQRRKTAEKLLDPADGSTVLRETTYTYDDSSSGRGLLSQTTIKDMDASNDVNITLTYDDFGRVIKRQQNSNFGDCDISFTVYDDMGHVVATICNYDPDTYDDPITAQEAADLYDDVGDPDKNQVTTHAYDGFGRRIETTTDAGTDFARTTHFILDGLGRVTLKIDNYVDENISMVAYDDPDTWEWDATNGYWKDGSNREIEHGADLDENFITETVYNLFGQVRLQRDVLGHVVLYGYDLVGNLVKTVTQAATPTYNNDYTGDPDLSSYTENTSLTDADIISTFEYDAAGNQVKATNALGHVTFTVLDGLNRPVKIVQNAKDTATIALNMGDMGYAASNDPRSIAYAPSSDPDRDQTSITEYDLLGRVIRTKRLLENRVGAAEWDVMLYGYDIQGRQVRTIAHASQPTYDIASDPSLASYTESSDADVDHITETVYDIQNRVQYVVDIDGNKTWQVYDGFNRTVKQVVNTSYNGSGTAPESGSYVGNLTDPAADLISGTTFDDNGRVQKTRRVLRTNDAVTDLEYLWTLYGYDDRGRVIKVIENASVPTYNNSPTGDYDLSAYTPSSNDDEDISTETEYDVQGRVKKTTDNRGNVTLFGYDSANRRVKTIVNASVPTYDTDSNGDTNLSSYTGSTPDADEDQISTTRYDLAGRVISRTDVAGRVMVAVYDDLGRTTLTVENYIDENSSMVAYDDPDTWEWDATNGYWKDGSNREIEHGANNDENLIALTIYNKGGQVVATYNVKGTQTAFTYDDSGRRVQVTQAVDTNLETTSYTCFDKAGRMLRSIQNWRDDSTDPDARNSDGAWVFAPTTHGAKNDKNLIAAYTYDRASRRLTATNPAGDVVETVYVKNGQTATMTQKSIAVDGVNVDVTTLYRYDALRRRTLVVQGYNPENSSEVAYTDPATWSWSGSEWEDDATTPLTIEHGANKDENILVQAQYDKDGRLLDLRDPRGKVTAYEYDKRSRRTLLTDANGTEWATAYAVVGQASRVTMNYPGIEKVASVWQDYDVVRDFDRLGRLVGVDYSDAATTPKLSFAYDTAGNRTSMVEKDDTNALVRQTDYSYDAANRLIGVDFDTDGDTVVEQSVSYAYDERGLRTTMTMPGSMTVSYTYDEKGRLVSLTDWDTQTAAFDYDAVNRHVKTYRPNAMMSTYDYDAAGRLQALRHHKGLEKQAEFQYSVDARGNRLSAREFLAGSTVNIDHDDAAVTYKNTWSDTGSFHETTDWDAALSLQFWGDEGVQLVMGKGSDHSIFDVYINGTLWQSFDGYAGSTGEMTIDVSVQNDTLHQNTLEVRNRRANNVDSSGYKLRFKHMIVPKVSEIDYAYDALSRLLTADYADNSRSYAYSYDVAGNRRQEQVTIGITTTTTDWTYDPANRIDTMKVGSNPTDTFEYDANGNLIGAGGFTYTWDYANRLTALNTSSVNHHYAYDGDKNRVQQTVGGVATDYLLDIQPELTLVLGETKSGNTTHYLHSPRGIHAVQDPSDDWFWMVQDGLGSVRAEMDVNRDVVASRANSPYGQPFDEVGTFAGTFGFAGEQIDPAGQSYNRARYYDPNLGVFTSLDVLESGNRYAYVGGNPVSRIDPNGENWRHWLADRLEPVYYGFQDASNAVRDNAFWDWTENRLLDLEDIALNTIEWTHDNGAWEYYPAMESFRQNVVCNFMSCSLGQMPNPFQGVLGFERFRNDLKLLDCLPLEVRRELGYQMFAQPIAQYLQRGVHDPISRINTSLDQEQFLDAYLGAFDLLARGNIYETREGWVTRDPIRFVSGAFGTIASFAQGYGFYAKLRATALSGINNIKGFWHHQFGSTSFYTVQGPDDALRLRTTGEPWPTGDNRAHFGPGVYSWANNEDALTYQQRISRYPDLEIVRFDIRNRILRQLNQLDMTVLSDEANTSFMESYSLLWDGVPDHGYEYIIRATALGNEHYFHSSIFQYLSFK